MTKHGSILFFVLIFITVIGMLLYGALRTNSYYCSIMQARELYERRYQLTSGLCLVGQTAFANQVKDSILDNDTTILFHGPWPQETSEYEGIITLLIKKKAGKPCRVLQTDLMLDKKVVCTISDEYEL